jgi:hypothetical protein
MKELAHFRVIDAHAHNWSLFANTAYLIECLDRFDLRGIAILAGNIERLLGLS